MLRTDQVNLSGSLNTCRAGGRSGPAAIKMINVRTVYVLDASRAVHCTCVIIKTSRLSHVGGIGIFIRQMEGGCSGRRCRLPGS